MASEPTDLTTLLEEAERICEGVTPGPWNIPGANVFRVMAFDSKKAIVADGLAEHCWFGQDDWALPQTEAGGIEAAANMRFISRSRTLLPQLASACRKLLANIAERDSAHPWNVFKERDELQRKLTAEENDCLREIEARDRAQHRLDEWTASILQEDIDWSDHEAKWEEAERELSGILQKVGVRPSGAEGTGPIPDVPALDACCGCLAEVLAMREQMQGMIADPTLPEHLRANAHKLMTSVLKTSKERDAAIQARDDCYAYAEALQALYDAGGPMIEPAMAKRVGEMRDRLRDGMENPDG